MSVDHQQPRSRAAMRGNRPSAAVFRRRRIAVAVAAGVLVLGVAALTAFVWPGYAVPEPLPTPTVTITAPAPTPTTTPAERTGEQTALTGALPDVVRQFTQQGIQDLPEWQDDHHATEAWTVTYADAVGSDAATITVQVGQWADDAMAQSFADAQVAAAGTAANTGDVTVDGTVTGTYALFPAGDGAVIWWRNGTVVIRAEGPADQLEDFYAEYPL
ncbi:hypothetical protein [Xylanimonas protaetiae]|uniref:DUF4245 domain-containing protein n=1 Tax=Xylanimonas protaetiae TaxID=2509457 RepID=A0A4P6F977_9MICO|nr:hypothetical protein [Xylanimonas protaetiae]QAY69897.1 hypothetical protein ET471_07505 [Xylanimonas protaetiae]